MQAHDCEGLPPESCIYHLQGLILELEPELIHSYWDGYYCPYCDSERPFDTAKQIVHAEGCPALRAILLARKIGERSRS